MNYPGAGLHLLVIFLAVVAFLLIHWLARFIADGEASAVRAAMREAIALAKMGIGAVLAVWGLWVAFFTTAGGGAGFYFGVMGAAVGVALVGNGWHGLKYPDGKPDDFSGGGWKWW
jgi:hypothetical protein